MREKSYTLRLDESEIERLKQLLSSDEDEDTYCKIVRQQANNAMQNVLWFNLYYRQQVYGGPEEGGWWYDTTECVYSAAFPLYGTPDLRDKLNKRLLYSFFRTCGKEAQANCVVIDKPSALFDVYVDKNSGALVLNKYAGYTEADADSNGHMIARFEYAPGIQQCMERQQYC